VSSARAGRFAASLLHCRAVLGSYGRFSLPIAACAGLWLFAACSDSSGPPSGAGSTEDSAPGAAAAAPGEPVAPSFAVKGELEGLLIVWFDEQGAHTAQRRSDIPEARRSAVRVASLRPSPGERPDPDQVYIADVATPRGDGSYPVWRRPRAWFDAQVEAARGSVELAAAAVPAASEDVTLYMASWCGACRSAAAYMRSREVPFVEKDIEKDAAASAEMRRKAQAAGKTPRGVPVIDFRGHIVLGFDRGTLDRLIEQTKAL
jgi:glutaredoxin